MSLLICLFLCIRVIKSMMANKSSLYEMDTATMFLVCPMVAILVALMSAVTGMCMMNQSISESIVLYTDEFV